MYTVCVCVCRGYNSCSRWCTTNHCVQEWWAVSVLCYHWPHPIVPHCSQTADRYYWTANKHPCVAWELPWTRDLTCSRSLSSRVPGPLEPLIVDCFWWASTEVRLYTGWNLSNTGHSEGWVNSTRTNTSDAASLVRVQYHTLSCIANNLIPQVSA